MNKQIENSAFPCPTFERLGEMNSDSIHGLAYALQHNTIVDSGNDFGHLTLEFVLMLLKLISESMDSGQTFKGFLANRITKG